MPPSTTDPDSPPAGERKLFWLLLLATLLHGLAYFLLLPAWMGEDEPWHVEYAHHVATRHTPWGGLPLAAEDREEMPFAHMQVRLRFAGIAPEEIAATEAEILASMRENDFWARVDWASWGGGAENFDQVARDHTATTHSPLYYAVSAAGLAIAGGGDVLREMWVQRCLALVCYLLVVLATYALARRVTSDLWIALVAALLVAWWPMHARQAGVANNDVLVKVFTSWALFFAVDIARAGATPKRVVMASVLALAAMATKTTAVGILVPLGLALLWRTGLRARTMSNIQRGAIVLGLAGFGVIAAVSYQGWHNPAVPANLGDFWNRFSHSMNAEFWSKLGRTLVGAFNWYSRDLPPIVHQTVGIGAGIGALGLVVALARRPKGIERGLTVLCLAAVLGQVVLITMRGVGVGRYLNPVLPALGLLLAIGLVGALPERLRARAAAVIATGLIVFDGAFLWSGLVWNQYIVWGG